MTVHAKHLLAAVAALVLAGSATPSHAYNCAIPAFFSQAKKAVCGSSELAALDVKENERRVTLAVRLTGDARKGLFADRQSFLATRNSCGADTRCHNATYRAQLRLYSRLDGCTGRAPAKQAECVTRTTERHREELHRSM